ncbi:hypothetical protein [uncultured Sunxiuqinia sp.]|uniref:hypothetical protein n=1 Tax=uncultured Sunxiuqinia sp. TaxID=1573825 RepID=UPI002AA91181|nr:hypothetical protein [uncultured Sunxiuqinia sp.]
MQEIKTPPDKVHIAGRDSVVRQLWILALQFRVLRTGTLSEIRPDNLQVTVINYIILGPCKDKHYENFTNFFLILSSCSYRQVKPQDNSKIKIEIKNDKEVLLNEDIVAIDDLEQKLFDLKSKDTIKGENYIILLDFDKNADNEILEC